MNDDDSNSQQLLQQIGIAFAMIVLFGFALLASLPPPPPSEIGEIVTRSFGRSLVPAVSFLGFIYLHNGKRHVVNIILVLIFFVYAWGIGQCPYLLPAYP